MRQEGASRKFQPCQCYDVAGIVLAIYDQSVQLGAEMLGWDVLSAVNGPRSTRPHASISDSWPNFSHHHPRGTTQIQSHAVNSSLLSNHQVYGFGAEVKLCWKARSDLLGRNPRPSKITEDNYPRSHLSRMLPLL